MATETTLGERLLDAADQWAGAVEAKDFVAQEHAIAALRTLAARATAAERLAVACDREVATRDVLNAAIERMYADPDKGSGMDTEDEAATFEAACNDHDNALAAWRAINGEATNG